MNAQPIPPPSIPGFEHIQRYWDKAQNMVAARLLPGDYYVTRENEKITTVLGSCISACIRDVETGVGGMNHFMLPETEGNKLQMQAQLLNSEALRFGNYAMEHLINTILSYGGKRKNLEVKVFGGAKMIATLGDTGQNNIDFILDYIDAEALMLVAQDLGDIYPRKIHYFPRTGRVRLKKIKALEHDALISREKRYQAQIKKESFDGDIELF